VEAFWYNQEAIGDSWLAALNNALNGQHRSAVSRGTRGNTMTRTVEATIDEHGSVHLHEEVHVETVRRALVTILEEPPQAITQGFPVVTETALLSEAALARDWMRPEEDEAWSHLQ
jgi:hypothetical protein